MMAPSIILPVDKDASQNRYVADLDVGDRIQPELADQKAGHALRTPMRY